MKPISKWNYFMSLAFLSARRSKDPSTGCGAAIISPKGRVLGLGYNGFPNGCKDIFPWERDGDFMETKYAYVVHAEANAIYNSNGSLEGADIFCTLYPCHECAKAIVQSGIQRVVYWDDKYHDENFTRAARRLFAAAPSIMVTIDLQLEYSELEFEIFK
jgi:dCMP deaminase